MAGASRRAFFYCNASAADALAPMPHFFFDIREGVRFTPDDEGLEFTGIDAAEHEAAETAAAIGRDLLPKGVARSVTVEVRNPRRDGDGDTGG